MKKRVLSLLLCLVMALSLIPTVAFAATHIDTVKINGVKTPRIGAKAGSFLRLTTPDSTYTIVKSYWVCSGSGALDDNGVFEEGKEYSLCVTVMPANGYYLDRNTEFVFNGGAIATQVSSKDASADGSLYRNTMPIAAANEAVDTVNIIGIKMPMSGVKAGDNLKSLMPASAGYTIAEAVWMCLEDTYNMTDDDVFETEKTYILNIGVKPKEGYTLNIDTGFIFNSGAVEALDDYYKNMVGDELYYFTAPIAAKVYIDTVNITGVKTPVVGAKAGDFLNLSTAASTYTIAGADWRCKTDSRVLFSGDAFEAEKDYYLGVELTPADGYIMDDSTKVLFNGGAITADSSTWVSSDGHLHGFTIPATIGKKYNVTFHMNGYGTAPAAQAVLSGSKAAKPADPTASGYIFGGWYKDAACITAFDFNAPITADTAVYAKWSCAHASTKATTTKATLSANGKVVNKCSVCGKTISTKTVYMPKTFSLSYTKTTYNGKVKTPTVTVKDSKGNVLKKGTDYKVTYATGRKAVGTYKVTIEGIGKYSFKKTLSFKINPAATKIISATNVATKSIKVKWNKAAGAGGYQVKYIKGTIAKTVTIKGASSLTKTLSKLTKGATYKVYVRSYKTVNSTNYYSAWSAYKSVKVAK